MPACWNFPSSKRPNPGKNLIWAVYVGRQRRSPWLDEFSAWRQCQLLRGAVVRKHASGAVVRKHASGSTRRRRSNDGLIPITFDIPSSDGLIPIVPSTMQISINGRVLSEEELQEIMRDLRF